VETLLTRLCCTQTRRIIENNFYSSNQVCNNNSNLTILD
jgi:hypothetical protein